MYNIPVRTGRRVELPTIERLVDEGHVQGIKDATGSVDMSMALHHEFGDDLPIFSGDDSLNLKFLGLAGASGAISVASHWAGELMQTQFEVYSSGDKKLARRIDGALQSSYDFESAHTLSGVEHDTPNPVPTKVMMGQILGEDVVGPFISPMLATRDELDYLGARATAIRNEIRDAISSHR